MDQRPVSSKLLLLSDEYIRSALIVTDPAQALAVPYPDKAKLSRQLTPYHCGSQPLPVPVKREEHLPD